MDIFELAEYIREKRGRLTQLAFAVEYGVSRQTVWMWERGDAVPSASILAKMGIRIVYEESSNVGQTSVAVRPGIGH
jgi:transcriptional regulator with XRE-family HTH domain